MSKQRAEELLRTIIAHLGDERVFCLAYRDGRGDQAVISNMDREGCRSLLSSTLSKLRRRPRGSFTENLRADKDS